MIKNNIEEHNQHILIVEDSLTQAEQLRYILEKRGYKVTVAVDGKKALDYLRKNRPFIIISDVVMPEIDGYELCQQIKSNEKLRDIPVILLTSLSDPEDIIKGLTSGADNFLIKPYDENYLISRIEYIKANSELRKHEKSRLGVEISFGGKRHTITSDRLQIIDLLLSTYETAILKSNELEKAKKELEALNSQLERKVKERTAELSQEIEKRIQIEEHLRKLNRIYRVTSSINQSIVRCQDEQSLFREVCKVAVDEGKFKMALIWKLDTENKLLKVVENKGADFLDRYSEIDLSNEKNKINPIVITIDSKKCITYNDLESSYANELFGQVALEKGCNSACCIPIIVFGKPYGAIKLYHEQKNFFDKDEIVLLEEMGMDVSFCIEKLINDQKRLEAEKALVVAKEKAEESNRLKTEFLAQMSHEIRTPLNIMLSYSEILNDDNELKNNPEKKEISDLITSAGKRLIRTVDSILNMSELQIGAYEASYANVDIYEDILSELYKEYQIMAQEKNLTFTLNKFTDNTIINIDEYSVNQIFSNLIDNAIKYTQHGKVEINIKNEKNNLVVEVKDTGIGIAEEFIPHLFEPFRQESQGYTRKFEGNGLGLAIVKKYCEVNNAQIEVESKKGRGTTFRVIFAESLNSESK
ncbi:ATP-binding protein [Melioribacteraceae bacterium 4301-Me]|uniref:ATP-binding protein n=1 Tax=Pyranulibacter aquaticus TaxID=3163344 RepID=UPI00359B3F50